MGAWGHQFDENDDAADWLADFAESPNWGACAQALELGEDYVEVDAASCALAAAEVVAAGLGKPDSRLDATIANWAASSAQGAQDLQQLAVVSIEKIEDGSELQELWDEGDGAEWHSTLDDLKTRLN